jgi:hypothetical protein
MDHSIVVSLPNKLFKTDAKQLASFVPRHFSQQFSRRLIGRYVSGAKWTFTSNHQAEEWKS